MRDHTFFEQYARKKKMLPQQAVTIPEGRILLADSEEMIVEKGRMFYRTAWAYQRDQQVEFANYAEYELNDLKSKEQRLEEAMFSAGEWVGMMVNAGYFDGDPRHDFSSKSHN